MASSSTRTASSMGMTGRASNTKAGSMEQNLWTAVGVVAVEEHVAAPVANADVEGFDLEAGGGLPGAEDFEDALLCILVLDGGALGAFSPGEHVFHRDLLEVVSAPASPTGPEIVVGARGRAGGECEDCTPVVTSIR